jgi:hypothetical protein
MRKAVRGHAGIVIFALLLMLATLGVAAAFGLACAALRVRAWVGAAIAAVLFAAFVGYTLWDTLQKPNVPPLGGVFGDALFQFVAAAVVFLPPYFLAHYWLSRRRQRNA